MAGQTGSPLPLLLAVVLISDGVLVYFRIRTQSAAQRRGEAAFPRFLPMGRWLHGIRLLLTLGLVPALLLAGWSWAAVVAFSLALLVDRVAFYTLVVMENTESEVARVEGLL